MDWLKPGAKVWYGDIAAVVQKVRPNGIRIGFDGRGIRRGDFVFKTVSRTNLTERTTPA